MVALTELTTETPVDSATETDCLNLHVQTSSTQDEGVVLVSRLIFMK